VIWNVENRQSLEITLILTFSGSTELVAGRSTGRRDRKLLLRPAMRPFPVNPRGPRRRASSRPKRHVFGCPRISPEWELDAFHALIKPRPERAALLKAEPHQAWPPRARAELDEVVRIVGQRLGYVPTVHADAKGDYHFLAEVPDADIPLARATAILLSQRLAATWFVVGRVFVRDGRFFRRERGYRLNLVEASNVHLPRAIRAALRGEIHGRSGRNLRK
jgi:hypothetical protein